jgi:hypothetical protein
MLQYLLPKIAPTALTHKNIPKIFTLISSNNMKYGKLIGGNMINIKNKNANK